MNSNDLVKCKNFHKYPPPADLSRFMYDLHIKLLPCDWELQFCSGCIGLIAASLQVGVGITNALINARKALDKSFAGEAEDVPILSTSVAYGVYMAVSSNLR